MIRNYKLPPKYVSPDEFWTTLSATPRAHKIVPIRVRGIETEVAIVVLAQEEISMLNTIAEKKVKEVQKSIMGNDIPKLGDYAESYDRAFEEKACTEILFRVCKMPDDLSKPFFKTREQIGKELTTDEVAVLMKEYNLVRYEMGPEIRSMSEEEMEVWIEKIIEAGTNFLAFTDSELTSRLVSAMAFQIKKLQTGNSSAGLLPEDTTIEIL